MKQVHSLNRLFLAIAVLLAVLLAPASVTGQIITAPPPPAPVPNISTAGVVGFTPYYYVVVANYPAGSAASQVIAIQNGNATLTSSNYNVIGWQQLTGVLTYDVLKIAGGNYTGSCTCSLTTGLSPATTVYQDKGTGLSAYTQATAATAANGYLYLNNRDYAFPKYRLQLNGADHLAENPSGTGVPGYCTVGDTFYRYSVNLDYGCTAPNVFTVKNTGTSSPAPAVKTCGTTSTCSHAAVSGGQIVFGSAALVSASPSAVTVTGITGFTSSTSFICAVSNATTAADGLKVVNASASSITITGPNTVTDTANFICTGN